MYQVMEAAFWVSVLMMFYTYVGYPMFVYVVARIIPKATAAGPFEPSVTVLITAYNEERDIKEKIENTLLLEYPSDKLEVVVASDGSTDATD